LFEVFVAGLEGKFFFSSKKVWRMNAGWFIPGRNHSHLLQRVLFLQKKRHCYKVSMIMKLNELVSDLRVWDARFRELLKVHRQFSFIHSKPSIFSKTHWFHPTNSKILLFFSFILIF
jgi:hypothetical protein